MELNFESSLSNIQIGNNFYSKISLTKKSKIILLLRMVILSFCCIFFPLEAILDSSLEKIEKKLYLNNKNIIVIKSKSYLTFVDIFIKIFGSNQSIIIFISVIYLIFHPFIGLKLILVSTIFHYIITILQIIYKAHRPFWDIEQPEISCRNSYPNPSISFFYCSFFYLYLFISFNMFKKKKFTKKQKIIILLIYLIMLIFFYFLFVTSFFLYHHQIVYTTILSLVILVFLIDYDTKIYNFIFNSLKNLYNTRVYKMKIFFFVLGLFAFGLLGLFFVEDNEESIIKENLNKNNKCTEADKNTFGIKEGIVNASFLAALIGAFWGSAFTVEKKIGKWWSFNSKKKIIIKISCTLFVCALFNVIFYFMNNLKNNFELFVALVLFLNFFESYCIFGLMPLFFQKIKYNENYISQSYEKINVKLTNEEDVHLFRNTIFINEKKGKKDVFVVVNKTKEKDKIKEEKSKVEKNIKETQKKLEKVSINDSNIEDSSYEKKNENKEKEIERKDMNLEPSSTIIDNMVEIKEDEGDYEFDIDNEKLEKSSGNINKLKEDLINNDNDEE